MKAVGYSKSLPIDAADALIDFETAKPEPSGRDLRVAVKAVSVNPVDTKVRKRAAPPAGEMKILGFDAAGVVDAVGPEATLFKPGDEVFYAGSILRQGTNSEFHLVDERIVGRKPKSLGFAQAAALPLTSITAWELLFDRLDVQPGKSIDPRTLLIVGGAGGVGSILIQLARRLTGLAVVATASRPESIKWCLELGAHAVVDHSKPLKEQIDQLKLPPVRLIASLTNTDQHFPALVDILAPQGKIGLIDDPAALNATLLKGKAASLHWESMFTRSSFQTADMIAQHRLLNDVANLIDNGVLRTTLDKVLGRINAATLKQAHAAIEGGRSTGKLVLEGW
ncbi:zinc-binding alcohol dehydrogenase family protein [Bradyrhizobium sp. U87765 SZCCT0131]|uniref:zinc-binding alcohol dehydrogenase family protein n=1 Tax=unclassified Bradyrhizobium TaxID=2631580 RepID=UPI001BA871E2|nr:MULTISPECIES: zinc-binding alcohol dehydrogenase family protein [unclassified Bradyrhizobium]MBR1223120.1 zinc-binding alcohol dehydrogenase family protein [Bradyrhizobium sp. U87765 SZCCT0131]MBR1262828.1 zinc-binding alcohol dehydrogenase family protein [Bradyrhizobium sp. U87765 SZCCT0134]MBR1309331.1 zinc-binding alcohol dehydrogenase family protein [Bradyrhizobium sp. U87765 SZCCT0110]MBR1318637.1 zinc-binding alcohol dehydrogenase family protein [Bradyrhizobium sp. U87765 SZCCT0109]MB